MKQITFLLFLFICGLPIISHCNNSEKNKLPIKIKKGDTWNVTFETDEEQLKEPGYWNWGQSSGNRDRIDWEVKCEDIASDSFQLRFTLKRWIACYKNQYGFSYNDTEYPAELSKEFVDETQKVVGRSILFNCSVKDSCLIEVISNQLLMKDGPHKWMFLKRSSIMNKFIGYGYRQTSTGDVSNQIGVPVIAKYLNAWLRIVTLKKIPQNVNLKNGKHKGTFSLKSEKLRDIEILSFKEHKKWNTQLMIDRKLRLPLLLKTEDGSLIVTTSGLKRANTQIKIDHYLDPQNSYCKLIVEYPKTIIKEIEIEQSNRTVQLDLNEPIIAKLKLGQNYVNVYIEPYADLNIELDIDRNYIHATGKGAEATNCFNEYQRGIKNKNIFNLPIHSINEIELICKTNEQHRDRILEKYGNRISAQCRQLIKTDSYYWKGRSIVDIQNNANDRLLWQKNKSKNDTTAYFSCVNYCQSKLKKMESIGKRRAHISPSYHHFLTLNLNLNYNLFLSKRGRDAAKSCGEKLFFASIDYQGYPYFWSHTNLLNDALEKGEAAPREVVRFKELPFNAQLKATIDKTIAKLKPIEVGKKFSFKEIAGINHKLKQGKKNEFTFITLTTSTSPYSLKRYKQLIDGIRKKFPEIKKINHISVISERFKNDEYEQLGKDSLNMRIIYAGDKAYNKYHTLYENIQPQRIFLLDHEGKIIRNNIFWMMLEAGHNLFETFDEYFKKDDSLISKAGTRQLLLVLLSAIITAIVVRQIFRVRAARERRREEARRKMTEMELKAIRSQMNPHFIFNAMGSIQNLMNHNSIKSANLYLSRFARLMRMVLNNSNRRLVALSDEIELLRNYLELEQLRVEFEFAIRLDDSVDAEIEEIPGMLLQPFVENAVIHGITPKGGGSIDIDFIKKDEHIICTICDDGVGIAAQEKSNGNGVALKMSRKRLELLNDNRTDKLLLQVIDRQKEGDGIGTKIILNIPVG